MTPDEAQRIRRVVALGASNLTRGFRTVVSSAQATWGPGVDTVAAHGHGRSYGAPSSFLGRRLPSILQSGLWHHLASAPAVRTRALVTDVGNDVMYGSPPEQILAWVEDAVVRLRRCTADITLTDLPLERARRLSRLEFRAFTAVVVPSCRVTLADAIDSAERVSEGLAALASVHGLRFVHLRAEWYGVDPIHIRPPLWHQAWQEILGADANQPVTQVSRREGLRLYVMRPEQQWLFGREQRTPQRGRALKAGGHVWLF
ncbi:MAG: hypothetical protein NTY02_14400 [Acidobacteria bacterium]|nr:hypothetical protein [Acidobacteriota bacterium]